MHSLLILPFAALAASIVIPDHDTALQISVQPIDIVPERSEIDADLDLEGWEGAISLLEETLDEDNFADFFDFSTGPDSAFSVRADLVAGDEDDDEDPPISTTSYTAPFRPTSTSAPPPPVRPSETAAPGHPHHLPPFHHPPPTKNETVLSILQASNHTRIFSYILTTYSPSLTDLLNSTSTNITVFAPLDEGFKRLKKRFSKHKPHHPPKDGDEDEGEKEPPKWKKPSNETIEKWLSYHITNGTHGKMQLMKTSTLPTMLDGGVELGGSQRVRFGWGPLGMFGGRRVNFMSKMLFSLPAKNGALHALTLPLFPPPPSQKILSLLPSVFSMTTLALEKTGLNNTIAALPRTGGSTFFAPPNKAWERTFRPGALAFLFGTEKGTEILDKIMRYHVVMNTTVYTDAVYPSSEGDSVLAAEDDAEGQYEDVDAAVDDLVLELSWNWPPKERQIEMTLSTLLDGKTVDLSIRRSVMGNGMRVNKRTPVREIDVPARDGVMQVVGLMVLPPFPKKEGSGGLEIEDVVGMFAEEVVEKGVLGGGEL